MKKGTICKIYSKEDKDFIIKNYKDISCKDMALILGRTINSIRVMASKLGLGVSAKDLIIGDKFNRLTVVSKTNKRTNSRAVIYECKCDCGTISYVARNALEGGHTKSCGCFQRERVSECLLLPPGQATLNNLYQNCISNARSRDVEFLLTREQHAEIISKNCHYCGKEPRKMNYLVKLNGKLKKLDHNVSDRGVSNSWTVANTVDRVDSKEGYTVKNCVPSCWPCNEMKNDRPIGDFLLQVNKISEFQKKRIK